MSVPDERPLHAPAFKAPAPVARRPRKARAKKNQAPKAAPQPVTPDETPSPADDTDTEEK